MPFNGRVAAPDDHLSTTDDYIGAFNSMLAAIELVYPRISTKENKWRDDEDWEEDSVFFPFP
jgi:hypothetical protein